MKIKSLLFLVPLFIVSSVYAAKVDTVMIHSDAMNKKIQTVIVTPDGNKKYPVVYLLHGHGGNAKAWINIKPDLPKIADEKGIIFVCPDGKNSWYWDSPKNPAYRYETFISGELVKYVDSHYNTVADRKGRAIAGLSMGGHGAMWNALRHKNVFGAVGSVSGGLDIRPFPMMWNMNEQLGKESENSAVWDSHTVINQIGNLKNGDLAIIFDCGYDDFFFGVNNNFHSKLLKYKIDHDFIARPGGHTGDYWSNAIDYQVLFFKKYFDKNL